MIFYMTRHGETNWNVEKKIQGKTDIPLNETGKAQARLLAERLRDGACPIHAIYTSPQKRALETAEIVASELGTADFLRGNPAVRPLDNLREMDLGEWEGSKWDIIKKEDKKTFEEWQKNRRYMPTPGGESYNEVLERMLKACGEILRQTTEDVLIVTHSAVLRVLRCYLAGCPFTEEMTSDFRTENAGLVSVEAPMIERAIRDFEMGK